MFSSSKDKSSFSIVRLVSLLTIVFLLASVLVPASWYKSNMILELNMGEAMTGKQSFNQKILPQANSLYKSMFIETGVDSLLKNYFKPPEDANNDLENTFNSISNIFLPMLHNIATVTGYHLYMMTYRVALLSFWLFYFFIMLIPAFISGYCQWQRKQYDFSYVSPFLNRRSMKLIGICIYFLVLTLIIPLPVPPIINAVATLFVIPMAVILVISNLPKQI